MPFDVGIGLILASFIGIISEREPSLSFLMLGAASTLAPDLDFLYLFWKQRGFYLDEWAHHHRDGLHYPLIVIPIGGAIAGWFLGTTEALLAAVGFTLHLIHDSGREGWGIRWLWPIDRHYFSFRKAKHGWKLFRWTREDQDRMVRAGNYANWVRDAYATLNARLMKEFAVFALGIIAAWTWYML